MNLNATIFVTALALGSPAAAADAPAAFDVQEKQVVLTLQGIGAQIYQCTGKPDGTRAWAFREPVAALMRDGASVGRHYAGPTWDIGPAGVTGKPSASAPGATPDDIPLLRVDITGHHGEGGSLGDAKTVLRLHTSGGVLAGACDEVGALRSIPYRAEYVFLK